MMIGVAAAQSTTEGAIGGTVVDNTGAVVSKAQVTARNNGTNAEKSTITDSAGYYRIIQLQPGIYTVTVSQQGFAPFKSSEVTVQVGSLTELSPHLTVGGTVETVQVSSETPQINYNTPELAATLNQTAISNLPINGGRWSNFTLLTPGVVSNSSGFGLTSFRGISVLLNNNTVDGADNNQAFFSEERGRTRAGYSTPKVAIEEFQVNTSNYSAEYGRSAGGVVNTVTKSGTNQIHGEAYFYDRDNDWGATNPFSKIQVPNATGTAFNPVPFKPKDWRKMTGFGVGGPAIKDKLFWFLAYDYYIRNFPGFGVASNPTVFFAPQTTASTNIVTLAQRLNGITTAPSAAQLTQALNTWNTDLAGLNTMLGSVPRTGEQFIFLPKIDWIINQKNHASFSFNRMRWASPAGIQTQGTNTNGIASFGNDFVKDTWGVAKLDTTITSNIVNELRYQYGRDFEFENNQTPTPYEQSTLVNTPTFTNPLGLPPQVSVTNGFTFGTPSFLERPKFPDETRQQIADTVSWNLGKHSFKFGMDFSHVHDNSQNLRNQFGSYSYSSLLNYFSDLHTTRSCTAKVAGVTVAAPCYSSYSQAFGPLGFQFSTDDIAFFAEDDWKILPRLSLSLGLRYEYEMLPSPFSNLVNSAIPQTAHMPGDKNNLGPRVGFSYDIFGDGKTVLRGGYGIFFGRIINSTIFTALTSSGIVGSQLGYSFSASNTSPLFPTILTTQPPLIVPPNVTFFDHHFQNPQIHQADLTLEHNLGWDTVLSISYLGSFGRELPGFADLNINPSTSTITYKIVNGGPITTPTLTEPLFSTRPTGQFAAMTDIFSGINSKYQALSTQLNHHLSHNIQFSANYTWAHALDFGQNEATFSDTNDLLTPGNLRGEYGNSIYDVRHRFVISAVATSPWKKSGWLGYITNGWQLSPIFQAQSGLPFSLASSGSAPGGEQFAGGGINGSGGAFRVDVIGRNTFRQPPTYVQDLRLSKQFSFHERYNLELLADVFNLANHTNVTGVTTTGYSVVSSGSIATPTGPVACSVGTPCLSYNVNSTTFVPAFGTPTSANSNFAYSPRQVQLGIRVKF
ncbi:MAG TPA: TonB-dependent receptor [Terriglobales bacterium]|nr:TonB-dependent receptor [Terriglobales bacterium]